MHPLGPTWRHLSAPLASLRSLARCARSTMLTIFAPSWPVLAPTWHILAPSWGILAPSWHFLAPAWAVLANHVPSWLHLGPSWHVLTPSWAIFAPCCAVWAPSWSILGASWPPENFPKSLQEVSKTPPKTRFNTDLNLQRSKRGVRGFVPAVPLPFAEEPQHSYAGWPNGCRA